MRDGSWVRETTFGTWFIGTKLWRYHVVRPALDDLHRLVDGQAASRRVVLDVGCGCGRALRLIDLTFRPDVLVGVDVDRVQLARGDVDARRCRATVALCAGSAGDLPLGDGLVDLVVCHQTFHHLTDQDGGVREFYRVLRPGGFLLFAESTRRYIRSLPIRLLFRHPMWVQKTASEYVALLREAGFEVAGERVSTPYPWWSRPDLGLAEWLGRSVSAPREPTILHVAAMRPFVTSGAVR